MKTFLDAIVAGERLTVEGARQAMLSALQDTVTDTQRAAFLTAFRVRGVTLDELDGFAQALRSLATSVSLEPFSTVDLCGTGGDEKSSFNISTTTAFVLAGAGYKVAKHGNYAVSSMCGSSNVLEELGIRFSADREKLLSSLDRAGVCFLHAPLFHPAMKAMAPVRKELAFRTVFNMLGPLLNPSQPAFQMNGVYDHELLRLYGLLLKRRGCRFATLVSRDGYDEVTLTGHVSVVTHRGEYELAAGDFGLAGVNHAALRGGKTVAEAARIVRSVLEGAAERAIEDVVVANAGLAIFCNDSEMSLQDCVLQARESIRSGRALQALKRSADIA